MNHQNALDNDKKKTCEEEAEAPSSTLYVLPCSLALQPPPNHSTTEWLHSLWSQSTPISLCCKLCLHTVSADHLLVQRRLLKTEMTEHGGGRGGWVSVAVLVCLLHVWFEKRDAYAESLHPISLFHYLFIFLLARSKVRKGREWKDRNIHVCECFWERKEKDDLSLLASVNRGIESGHRKAASLLPLSGNKM